MHGETVKFALGVIYCRNNFIIIAAFRQKKE